ncbi:MAG TPA: hypothetical protein VJY62_05655, partial [Bacteroidia bacterium]|nr:hypothetical protein [Bacteroidia bacterium]
MKTVTSFILILCVSLVSMSKSVICFSYELNKDFISKHLCENRNKPQLHCHGKCHIIKKLTEENKRENLPCSIKSCFEMQLYSEKTADYNLSSFYSGEILFSHIILSCIQPDFIFFHL